MRSTLFIFLLFLSACNPTPPPSAAHQLTPATFSDADFSAQGHLAISLREQVAIFDQRAEMLQLIEMGEAKGAWQLVWVRSHLLAIVDRHQILLWNTREEGFSGNWDLQDTQLRALAAANGRLLLGDNEGGLHLFAFTGTGALHTYQQPDSHLERISTVALSSDGNYALTASLDGQVRYWSLANLQPEWQWQAPAQLYATHATLSPDGGALYISTARRGSLLGSPAQQSIVHLDPKNGTIQTSFPFSPESHITSLLASDLGLFIGGSSNQWWLMQEGTLATTRKYPRGGPFGENSGTLAALYSSDNSIYAATTSGYLQIWLKQDIVN
jgi:WD40 repeat protein